nr:hypothetical protein [Tanacetum cinerariifolium]
MLKEVKSWLCKCFSMKDLGEEAYILGIKIIHDRSKRLISLSQSAHLEKILKKFRMENSKKGYTPMMEKPDYRKSQGAKTPTKVQQRVPYASAIGSIMYAVRCTRPDVFFAQNLCSRFQQNPAKNNTLTGSVPDRWEFCGIKAMRIGLSWIRRIDLVSFVVFCKVAVQIRRIFLDGYGILVVRINTKDMVLVYGAKPKDELKVSCYADASFQTDKDDTKSQTGYEFVLNGRAIKWKSANQNTTAMSSTEAEYNATTEASMEANEVENQLGKKIKAIRSDRGGQAKYYCMSFTEAEYIATTEASIEAVWIRKFIDGLGGVMQSNKRPMEMLSDNEPTIAIANDLKIIEFSDSYQAPPEETGKGSASESSAKKKGRTIAITTDDMQKRRNDGAILKTFGGNEATKKTKKNKLKQQYGECRLLDNLDKMSLDDVYNHLKVYEPKVQKKSDSNSQNMTFISSSNTSSRKGEVHTASVPTDSTQVSTASTKIKYEDITQTDEDDIEEIDIKWNMALLSMRADWFWMKTGKKITIQGSDVAGFDKSKVECFNCHKMGYFAREYKAPRSQDRENHALVADEEVTTKFALMVKSSSSSENEVYDDSLCSKSCLSQVKARLVEFKAQEIKLCEKIRGLERDVKASVDESMLWHRRLGHLNFKTMNKLVRNNLVKGLPSKCFKNDHTCVACLKGKQHKASCKTKLVNSVSTPLYTLHMDLFGPTSVSSLNHKWYCLVVTNDFSRCDNGGEFKNKEMNEFCTKKRIKRESSNARTPQQNRVAERRNRTLIEAAKTMLADAKLLVTFWAKA